MHICAYIIYTIYIHTHCREHQQKASYIAGIALINLIANVVKQFYNLYSLPYFIFSERERKEETEISPSSYSDHRINVILLSSLHYFSPRNHNTTKR